MREEGLRERDATARPRRPTAPPEQGVTFVELFFDLVFVYAITQVTTLLRENLTATGLVHAIIIFWLVWWAWTQFTWSLNPADTEHTGVRLAVLAATAIAFFMAQAVSDSFGTGGVWFALSYAAVRIVGLRMQWWMVAAEPAQRRAFYKWLLGSVIGIALVITGGIIEGDARAWIWLAALIADLFVALHAGRGEWQLAPGHFAERHSLIIIIALGESLIAVGVASSGLERTADLMTAIALGVAGTCTLWWTYFEWPRETIEGWFAATRGSDHGRFARDVYSFLHFPILAGVIGFAVAVEEAVAHPVNELHLEAAVALAVGTALFLGGVAAIAWRVRRRLLIPRIVAVLLIFLVIPASQLFTADIMLGFVAIVTATVGLIEHVRHPFPHEAGA